MKFRIHELNFSGTYILDHLYIQVIFSCSAAIFWLGKLGNLKKNDKLKLDERKDYLIFPHIIE